MLASVQGPLFIVSWNMAALLLRKLAST